MRTGRRKTRLTARRRITGTRNGKRLQPSHPHQLVLDLGKPQTISGFRYVPRQGEGAGRIKDYQIFVGDGLVQP